MMPTPTASDHIERNSTSTEAVNPLTGKSVSLDRFVKFWPDEETQQSGQPRMWPTPTAEQAGEGQLLNKLTAKDGTSPKQGERAYNPETGRHVQVTLNRAVKMWPTPTANEDACGTPNGKMQKMRGNHPDVRNTGVGTLNPQWVEWLMGYPEGWTDLKG
tara:strand:+ start:13 stop:489 length:477 start_codon:yes stop_codon:yes gene_type:complete